MVARLAPRSHWPATIYITTRRRQRRLITKQTNNNNRESERLCVEKWCASGATRSDDHATHRAEHTEHAPRERGDRASTAGESRARALLAYTYSLSLSLFLSLPRALSIIHRVSVCECGGGRRAAMCYPRAPARPGLYYDEARARELRPSLSLSPLPPSPFYRYMIPAR